jgi:hypothetical protein
MLKILRIASLAEMKLYLKAIQSDVSAGIILPTREVNKTIAHFWIEISTIF